MFTTPALIGGNPSWRFSRLSAEGFVSLDFYSIF
jgi:hypothetical protein